MAITEIVRFVGRAPNPKLNLCLAICEDDVGRAVVCQVYDTIPVLIAERGVLVLAAEYGRPGQRNAE